MASATASSAVKTYSFSELRQYTPPIENNRLIGDGILNNNSLLSIVGLAKSYKSFVIDTLAVDLCTGRNLFAAYRSPKGRPVKMFEVEKTCRCLVIEQELGEPDLKERLIPIYNSLSLLGRGLMDSNLFTHSLDHRIQLDTQEGCQLLDSIISDIKPEVLILDPLIEFHTSNENDTQAMNKIMRNFDILRERYSPLAIVFSHHEGHFNAKSKREGIDRFRGNTVIGGKVDGAMMVTVHNRAALILKIDFVLRRGKPLDSIYVKLDDNLHGQFLCWHRDKDRKAKIGKRGSEDEATAEGGESFFASVQ